MELLGRGYLIDHSMASLRRIREQKRFQIYIADGLFAITNNLQLIDKYSDLIAEDKKEEKPEKTAEEIKDKLRRKFAG